MFTGQASRLLAVFTAVLGRNFVLVQHHAVCHRSKTSLGARAIFEQMETTGALPQFPRHREYTLANVLLLESDGDASREFCQAPTQFFARLECWKRCDPHGGFVDDAPVLYEDQIPHKTSLCIS
ncbi:hypothetical protein Q31a_51470 [Aureliella helgolandensis]|uniref:Uncharacterized protein n=1 Tax=Aureliella helgolandensis TaxID=2527968 RepID=A0A518GDZ4_9BACT|nr:hypothetical protein Q31a_51470 [Aureliella helgolandensis]